MPVNIAKPKRWAWMFQVECEWQAWWVFFRRQKTKIIDLIYLCILAIKITEQETEHMRSDSSDPRGYFVVLVRQIEDSQQS